MEIQWEIIAKWLALFILSFLPALHSVAMKARYGIRATGQRSILRINLYDFGLMASTATCTAGIMFIVLKL